MTDATQSSPASSNTSLISQIKEGFSAGLATIGQDVLPVWAASQLKTGQTNQLADPTYNSANEKQTRLDAAANKVSTVLGKFLPTVKTDVGFTPGTMLLIGGTVVAGALVFYAVRKRR